MAVHVVPRAVRAAEGRQRVEDRAPALLRGRARAMRALVVEHALAATAHASPAGDVTKAFQSFVDTAGTAEPRLEVFIPPQGDSPEDNVWPVMPKDRGEVRGYLDHPRVVVKKLVVS